jgi:hypothetical protein
MRRHFLCARNPRPVSKLAMGNGQSCESSVYESSDFAGSFIRQTLLAQVASKVQALNKSLTIKLTPGSCLVLWKIDTSLLMSDGTG